MAEEARDIQSTSIRAAGGIVLGFGKNAGKIAIVKRRRYGGEVGLPKGKLKRGEDDSQAALREVYEETGIRAAIKRLAGTTNYLVGSVPKTVTYFVMETQDVDHDGPQDIGEVLSMEWIDPKEAVAILTHREDRNLISKLFGVGD
jgi:8-oxo-dGTP pyrophosphatase MutT (NUDIX family)